MTPSRTSENLEFVVRWDEPEPRGTAAEATRGRLVVRLGESLLWGESVDGSEPGIDWTWIELLEHLAREWNCLLHDEGDPLGLGVSPNCLRLEAEKRWAGMAADQRDREVGELCAFEEVHDLSLALQGIWVPSMWIVRSGRQFVVTSEHQICHVAIDVVTRALTKIGDTIAARIENLRDERAEIALANWKAREQS